MGTIRIKKKDIATTNKSLPMPMYYNTEFMYKCQGLFLLLCLLKYYRCVVNENVLSPVSPKKEVASTRI